MSEAKTATTSPGDEREAFEAWYVADAIRQGFPTMTVEEVKNLRDDDHYGAHRAMLNGKWEGWQARASSSTVQQVGADALDAARYRWLRSIDSYGEWQRVGHYAADALDKLVDDAIASYPKSEQGDQQ